MQAALVELQSEEAALRESEERYRTLFDSLTDTVFIRKQAQQDLKENEAKLRAIFEQSPEALFIDNENDEFMDANPAACQLLGYTRDELGRKRMPDFIAPELRIETGVQIKTQLGKNSP